MKTLHLGMIIGISVIALTSFGVFIEKLNEHLQQPYINLFITGLKENYTVNDPVSFSVTLAGYGTACGDTIATITRENDSKYQSPGWANQIQCVANPSLHDFRFTALSANTSINQTGNYVLTVSFDDLFEHQKTVKQKFSVFASTNTSIFDTGIYPFTVGVTNANFTIHYNISGNNKLLDANMNLPSKSLVLSLQSTNNGTLIVSVPRALLDIKKNDRGMGQFYMLANGQETAFKEIHTTLTDRVFSIPFQNGTKSIEIIATELI